MSGTIALKNNIILHFDRNSVLLGVLVPVRAPDKMNTVIVLETTGNIETDVTRLVSADIDNHLLAFDAELIGKEFSFGDGKANHYYVNSFTHANQLIKWDFRTIQPAEYKVVIKYLADNADEGSYKIELGDFVKNGEVSSSVKETVKTDELGNVNLKPGSHTLTITPLEIKGGGLIKLLEVQLLPLKSK